MKTAITDQYRRLFELSSFEIDKYQMLEKIIKRIEVARVRKTRIRVSIYSTFVIGALVASKPIYNMFVYSASHSGFFQYLDLAISESVSSNAWKSILYSVVESMPVLEIVMMTGIMLVIAQSLKHVVRLFSELSVYRNEQSRAMNHGVIYQ